RTAVNIGTPQIRHVDQAGCVWIEYGDKGVLQTFQRTRKGHSEICRSCKSRNVDVARSVVGHAGNGVVFGTAQVGSVHEMRVDVQRQVVVVGSDLKADLTSAAQPVSAVDG